jgi:hypothetical protein
MKRISLIAVIALFASVTGVAQDTKIDVRYKIATFPDNFGVRIYADSLRRVVRINADSLHRVFGAQKDVLASFQIFRDSLSGNPFTSIAGHGASISRSFFNRSLEQLAQKKDVTAITVTKSLLDIMPEIHSYVEDNGIEIKKVIVKLEQIDVYTSKNEDAKKIMREICTRSISLNLKVLMRIKNEDDNIVFYGEQGNDASITSVIMFSDNQEECVLIRLTGVFNKDEIKQIIKIKGKKF